MAFISVFEVIGPNMVGPSSSHTAGAASIARLAWRMMNPKIKTEAVSRLFEAILTLEHVDECYAFFEDVCTINELLSLSQRYEVAEMLREKRTYLEIAEKTGASTATISRVNRSLNYGNDGYDMTFARILPKEDKEA